LAEDTVSIIACPVDYSANGELIRSLGELDESFS
jgi:acetolactate synthase-1/2/3 large subunit